MAQQRKVFSERLNALMVERNLYPSDVRKLTGLCRASIYDYLQGNREPTMSGLIRLARGLKVSTDWLCGLVD